MIQDIKEQKNAFLDYKNNKLKKRLTHGFAKKKLPFFHLFVLRNIGLENVSSDILERKNAFLGYKNKKFKKSKNCHFSKEVNAWYLYCRTL